ncbi:MAG TPA: gamma-glutamyl-gamma-aminobutyrate hydrolase family protein [Candidatus Solibacter sp.]|jgi:putative glutamine amidotransferase|nr:gamma-glutamyl-gamma-aminobutyrate hydrolase family protein [Candidatus Solibacter sp.]
MSDRPLVAVVGSTKEYADRPDLTVPLLYIEAIERAGGRPAVLHPVSLEPGGGAGWLEPFDALVLIGGGDIDPSFYGQAPEAHVYGVDKVRDAFEIELARAAVDGDVPLLAICRGVQVVNVAFGGTLDQHITGRPDLEGHGVPGGGEPAVHPVNIDPDSELGRAMGVGVAVSSCHHHQAVAELGRDLRPVAWTEDGVIEALELPGSHMLAVQWHPEDTAASDVAQQRLFDAVVRASVAASR